MRMCACEGGIANGRHELLIVFLTLVHTPCRSFESSMFHIGSVPVLVDEASEEK